MRLDPLFVDQPGKRLGRAVGGVGDQALRVEAEAVERARDHVARRLVLGLPDRRGRLDIDDDGVLEVDEIVGGVEEMRLAAIRGGPARGGMTGETYFGWTGVAAPKAASSSVSRYSVVARLAWSSGRPAPGFDPVLAVGVRLDQRGVDAEGLATTRPA